MKNMIRILILYVINLLQEHNFTLYLVEFQTQWILDSEEK